jgi:hypothetical protein
LKFEQGSNLQFVAKDDQDDLANFKCIHVLNKKSINKDLHNIKFMEL